MSSTENKRGRGAYRVGVSEESERAELLRDPQVAEFARALEAIKDPKRRASVVRLVYELSKDSKTKRT